MIKFVIDDDKVIIDEMVLNTEALIKIDLPTSFTDKELVGNELYITCNPKLKMVYIGKKTYSFYDYMDMLRRLRYKVKGGR